MPSIFTKIIQGEIPCHKLYEDAECLAFLDVRPVKRGHALVIPKKEIDYLFDLEDSLLAKLMSVAKRIARALKKTVPCKKVGVMVAGLEVPHAHIHLIPMDAIPDLNFANARTADPEELKQLAETIRKNLV